MHRLTRRSVYAALRTGGSRYRNAAAPISCSSPFAANSTEESDTKPRWYSVLNTGRSNAIGSSKQLNLNNGVCFGNRYNCTATEASSTVPPPPAEKYEYQAEVSRLMDLIVNSLYSNKEVFLRELISNASDALNKLRFLSVTEPDLMKDATDLAIRIQTDKDEGTITITDSGIGMTRQDLVDCLGTIAQSGTAKFLQALKDSKDAGGDNNLIGQFGVGFYSAFLVADRVVVSTKSPKSDKQYVWEGEANASSYTIREEIDPEKLLPRGTRLTLHLKRNDKGFAHPERIQKLVKNYSQFVSFPIYTWQEKGYSKEVEVEEDPAEAKGDDKDETTEKKKKTKTVVERYWDWEQTNETQPIWLRTPKEVTTEEYNEFYKKTFNEYLDPLASSHFTTEGEVEFRSILYVPAYSNTERDDFAATKSKNIKLHVKRVFISDDFDGELFPRYLSFVKGVVDSNDLPLNVSREILQESRIVRTMRKRLVKKAFDMFLGISISENKEDYEKFWENFGKYLKVGCIEDRENHKRIAPVPFFGAPFFFLMNELGLGGVRRRIPYGYNRHLNAVKSMEDLLSNRKNSNTLIMKSVKIRSIYQSASMIAQEISLRLKKQKKGSFRKTYTHFAHNIPIVMKKRVLGIRISCSGRLKGKPIASTFCGKYGKTSGNVFNQKIDYAFRKVSTRYGILGVKVWISYSQKKRKYEQ